MELRDRIKTRRKALGISQEALARRADVSLSLVNQIERGVVVDPHYSTLVSIAEALSVSVSELLEETTVPLAEATERDLAEWLQERYGHAHLALPREELKRRADDPVFRAECREELEGVAQLRKQYPAGAGYLELFAGGETYSQLQRHYIGMLFASPASDEEVVREGKRSEELVR